MSARKRLGELLMDARLLTFERLEQALAHQQQWGGRLGQVLQAMGLVAEDQLLETLSAQLNVRVASEERLRPIQPSPGCLAMVPAQVARTQRILPIFFHEREKALTLAVADPQNLQVLGDIRTRNKLEGLRVLLASERVLDSLIALHYGPLILIAESDDGHAESLESTVAGDGLRVARARDFDGLRRLIEADPPAVLVVSSLFPELNRPSRRALLRSLAGLRDTTVVVLDEPSRREFVPQLAADLQAMVILGRPVAPVTLQHLARRPPASATPRDGLAGSLEMLPLVELVQLLYVAGRTVRITLKAPHDTCELVLKGGELVHARTGDQEGVEAFFAACTWEQATFGVTRETSDVTRSVHDNTAFLLMEGVRRADERKAGLASLHLP